MSVVENLNDLTDAVESINSSVITIKSRIFFEVIEKIKKIPRKFTLVYPPTQIGSGTVFEMTLIAAILNIFDIKKIVEIGTYIGFSTATMALNSDNNAVIYTIDLPESGTENFEDNYNRKILFNDWKKNDDFLRKHQNLVGSYYIDQLEEKFRKKVQLIKCDSIKLTSNVLDMIKGADLFFIDGGHAFEIIECDTNTALKSLNSNGLIIWHDYKSKTHTEVTQFIDDKFSKNNLVLHVENTMLALHSQELSKILKNLQLITKL